MKRLIICLDGTWNNASREVEKGESRVYRPTNVLKMARAICSIAQDGTQQISYYDAGVGAMNRAPDPRARFVQSVDRTLGGGWGAGFEVNIEEAFTFLSNNYLPGDEIYIFGFSRGAAQARSLAQLIQWTGGFPPKRDAYYVPKLFTAYLQARGAGDASDLLREINRSADATEALKVSIVPARIRFLGLWDTVLALGTRAFARHGPSPSLQAFHCSGKPPSQVEIVRHAVAIDESRHDFRAELFDAAESLEQRWFAGTHSNVGGGLVDDGLANLSLKWMCDEASAAGLVLDDGYLKYYRSNPVGEIQQNPSFYRMADFLLRPLRGYAGRRCIINDQDTIDTSVLKRMAADPAKHRQLGGPYRPANLLEFLARKPLYQAQLPADVQGGEA